MLFGNLNINEMTINRKFWKTVKQFLVTYVRPATITLTEKIKLSMTTRKFPTPLTGVSQILPRA